MTKLLGYFSPRERPANTSSFYSVSIGSRVLNTTMPFSAHRSRGMLFTPAPALAIASDFLKIPWNSCLASHQYAFSFFYGIGESIPVA